MKILSPYLLEKEAEIFKKFTDQDQPAVNYIKSASFLHFHDRTQKAIELLELGLLSHPQNEEIIRTQFSFLATSYNLLAAFELADYYQDIFEDDEYDNLTKAIDLINISLSLSPLDHLSDDDLIDCIELLQVDRIEKYQDIEHLIDYFRYRHQLPMLALGLAYYYAQQDNPIAQTILAEAYLFDHYGLKDIDKGLNYLNHALQQDYQPAYQLKEAFYQGSN